MSDERVGNWVKRENVFSQDPLSWASEQRVYEWHPSYTLGNAPSDPALEEELFSEESRVNSGINFKNYAHMKISIKDGPPDLLPLQTFNDASLHPIIAENVDRMRYSEPTPVQKSAIPIILQGYDIMACAQTGSGKTATFLIPIISNLVSKFERGRLNIIRPQSRMPFKSSPLLLVILPTRELAIQIFKEARRFTYRTPLRPVVIYGGAEPRVQREQVAKGADILIATPGRLKDMMERGIISLSHVRHVVLDEADRMLDMGFEPQIRAIIQASDLPRDESLQTLMFSATFPRQIQKLAWDFLKHNCCRIRVGRIGGTTSDITQRIIKLHEYQKKEELEHILLTFPPARTMIFVETKRTADNLDDYLYNKKFPTCSIHGDRTQKERELSLKAFKEGKSPILIATAVASRGLDIKDVMHVINYDLCNDIDEYVHRIGRTARVGNQGLATSFYTSYNEPLAPQLTKLLIECKQEVPDFLRDFINPNTTYETEDFIDEPTTSNADFHGTWDKNPNW
ncbi:P-loop containing nucleoside triphosphate hydrolase protein [Lobosporangium transversale]|uniref:ATP-dependent RNA helicase DED1 n=1 Tax=Lobosporangium transversale TaxID=64571 RepID=A0A1Y2GR97_9FUNG|nr:P-loop containing nucleoside triphosphate hydrolase protein [Lobosporangium transversale]ORZ16836.1 P-loop containing nucleoside triphosphate hydrolase protein [Lobosporangium transversale]|eukprot:XP_021881771.1 P-loop containing nucleoside triphosphate hydrolase protein [Lobosporangium transversale]